MLELYRCTSVVGVDDVNNGGRRCSETPVQILYLMYVFLFLLYREGGLPPQHQVSSKDLQCFLICMCRRLLTISLSAGYQDRIAVAYLSPRRALTGRRVFTGSANTYQQCLDCSLRITVSCLRHEYLM